MSEPVSATPCLTSEAPAPLQARSETRGARVAATRVSAAVWRERLAAWIQAPPVQNALIALILVNAAILGLETFPGVRSDWGDWLRALDQAILAVFVLEIALRLIAHRMAFFRDPWSVFDFLVVGIALMPASGPFAVLRALRVLRVMRLISLVPSMRRVAGGLIAAIPGLGAVFGMIVVILYVSAVVATKLFGERFPDWFGTLGESAFTLFQVMTLESWSMGIVRPILEVYPLAWMFFVVYILVSTFTMLNLFIAVVVNAMQAEHAREFEAEKSDAAEPAPTDRWLRDELQALHIEVKRLREALERNRPPSAATKPIEESV
ncbi:MAG: ion transporter [Burkholderiales bacterium]|nr:ion transporter [Burkholderiales bacterium]